MLEVGIDIYGRWTTLTFQKVTKFYKMYVNILQFLTVQLRIIINPLKFEGERLRSVNRSQYEEKFPL